MALDSVPVSLVVVVSVVAGVGLGVLVERLFGSAARRAAKFEADLVQARSDFMRYQEQTKQHFGKSAELLGRMATDYREFLHHFVQGAENLCGPNMRELNATLERPLLDGAAAAAARTSAPPAAPASKAAVAPPIPTTASAPPAPAAPAPPASTAPAAAPLSTTATARPAERPANGATAAGTAPIPPVLDQEPLAEDAVG